MGWHWRLKIKPIPIPACPANRRSLLALVSARASGSQTRLLAPLKGKEKSGAGFCCSDAHGFFAINEITSKCGGRFSRVTVSVLCSASPALSTNFFSSLSLKPRLAWP